MGNIYYKNTSIMNWAHSSCSISTESKKKSHGFHVTLKVYFLKMEYEDVDHEFSAWK